MLDLAVRKQDVELVIAHYDDDLSWTDVLKPLRTIYTKGTPSRAGAIALPNVGREQHTFVAHILRNYDRLAARTVFMHGHVPSCGFFVVDRAQRGGHLLQNVSVIDYLDPSSGGAAFAPVTMRYNRDLTRLSLRSTFADVPDKQRATQMMPRPVSVLPRGAAFNDTWLPFEHSLHGEFARRTNRADEVPITIDEFFEKMFGRPPPPYLYAAQGGQFAVSAETLRRLPRETYAWLDEQFRAGHEELMYYLELAWGYLLYGFDDLPHGGEEHDEATRTLPWLSHLGGPERQRQLKRQLQSANASLAGTTPANSSGANAEGVATSAVQQGSNPATWSSQYMTDVHGRSWTYPNSASVALDPATSLGLRIPPSRILAYPTSPVRHPPPQLISPRRSPSQLVVPPTRSLLTG